VEQEAQQKNTHSRLIAVARIIFAVVALGFVVYSIQLNDCLVKGTQQYNILKVMDDHYVVRGKSRREVMLGDFFSRLLNYFVREKSGQESMVSRADKSYQHHTGAVSLAKNVQPVPAILGLAIFSLVPLILAYRWRLLLKVQGVNLPFWKVLQLTYSGLFLNFFLIGTTGGDLVKAYWIGRFSPKRAEGFVSVFVDRFIGVVVLILMSAVLVVLMWHDAQVAKLSRGVGILVVLSAGAIVFLFSRRLRRLVRFDRWKNKLPISGMIDRIDQSLLAYRRSGSVLVKAAMATVVLQLLGSTASYFLGSALQINAHIWYYWLYVPLAFLIGSIPVSVFWGLGLLEGAYVGFFAGSGFASLTQAAMLAMAVRLMQLFWALPGSAMLAVGIGKKEPLATNKHEIKI